MNKKSIVAILAILALIAVGIHVIVQDAHAARGCMWEYIACCVDCPNDCDFFCRPGYPWCDPIAWCFCCDCACFGESEWARCCGDQCYSSGERCFM